MAANVFFLDFGGGERGVEGCKIATPCDKGWQFWGVGIREKWRKDEVN